MVKMGHLEASPRLRPNRETRYVPRAEPGSINHRMQAHPETSLFVRPTCFTDLHAEILRVRWREITVDHSALAFVDGTAAFSAAQARDSWEELKAESIKIWQSKFDDVVHDALFKMFGHVMDGHIECPSMHVWFGGRIYREASRTVDLWNFPSAENALRSFQSEETNLNESFTTSVTVPSSPTPTLTDLPPVPMMARLGRAHLTGYRNAPFRISFAPGNRPNKPVLSLAKLRAKNLYPANPDEDSFLITVFLSMAQRYFYLSKSPPCSQASTPWPGRGPPMLDFHDLKLRLLVDSREPDQFIVYTTTVTAAFLRQFHHPSKAFAEPSSEPAGMEITYAKVPHEPSCTFRERLGLALGEEIVGSLAVPQEKQSYSPSCSKRKRSVDDDDHDVPVLDAVNEVLRIPESVQHLKRRCLGETASRNPSPDVVTPETPPSDSPTSKEPTSKEPTSKEPTSKEPTSKEPTSKEPTSKELKGLDATASPTAKLYMSPSADGALGEPPVQSV